MGSLQSFNLIPTLTALENVQAARRHAGEDPERRSANAGSGWRRPLDD
jgi:predicted ABC-type transport system involved in lysophospholipase L1 biosynthesis ATPase subunit